jgi:hypothetical protein
MDLIEYCNEDSPITLTSETLKQLFEEGNNIVICDFHNCDIDVKYSVAHGGDEDYVIITSLSFYTRNVVEVLEIVKELTVCDFDSTVFHNGEELLKIFVTAHS